MNIILIAALFAAEPSSDRWTALCAEAQSAGKIPGLAVVIVRGRDNIFEADLGYSDLSTETKVDRNTVFELASVSKAFTGLALLRALEKFQVSPSAPIKQFIPWLDLRWNGAEAQPTLAEVLHQTSGVPAEAVVRLSSTQGEDAIEEMIRALMPLELSHAPGDEFEYSSVNYDLLGLVIEKISGQSFGEFLRKEVLQPAGLEQTGLRWEPARPGILSAGYKLGFWSPREYDPPPFEGNTPAAYLTSTSRDLAKWLKVQLGTAEVAPELAALVRQSQLAEGGRSYAAGWFVGDDGTHAHEGANPSFSSYVIFEKSSGLGVVVLANLNSEHTFRLGARLFDEVRGRTRVLEAGTDELAGVDEAASSIALAFGALTLAAGGLAAARRRRRALAAKVLLPAAGGFTAAVAQGRRALGAKTLLPAAAGLTVYCGAIYQLPVYFSGGVPWTALNIWAPASLVFAAIAAVFFGFTVFFVWAMKS